MIDEKLTDGWNEWAHRVLGDIERLESKQNEIFDMVSHIRIELAILKTKAAVFGSICGFCSALIVTFVAKYL